MATTLLTDADFNVLITDEHLLQATGGDNLILESAEKVAWRKIVSYLRARYDTQIIKDNITVYDEIREILLDIMMYNVLTRLTPKYVPEARIQRYQDAIGWLKEAQEGDINPELPEIVDSEGETMHSGMRIGGQLKNDWYY